MKFIYSTSKTNKNKIIKNKSKEAYSLIIKIETQTLSLKELDDCFIIRLSSNVIIISIAYIFYKEHNVEKIQNLWTYTKFVGEFSKGKIWDGGFQYL